MENTKLSNMLSIISKELTSQKVPFCLIGAMALGLYGLPRYTSDIDLLAAREDCQVIVTLMEKLGYACYQQTDVFAQFDSDLDVFGKVDYMFVATHEGKEIIERSIIIHDELFDDLPVIQPTDYIILKLMAIANNPDRYQKDESDISVFFNLYRKNLVPDDFSPLEKQRILSFADKFGQCNVIEKYFTALDTPEDGQYII